MHLSKLSKICFSVKARQKVPSILSSVEVDQEVAFGGLRQLSTKASTSVIRDLWICPSPDWSICLKTQFEVDIVRFCLSSRTGMTKSIGKMLLP